MAEASLAKPVNDPANQFALIPCSYMANPDAVVFDGTTSKSTNKNVNSSFLCIILPGPIYLDYDKLGGNYILLY